MAYSSSTYGSSTYSSGSTTSKPNQPYAWGIGGDGANQQITANGRLNGYTTPARGETRSFEFYFQDDSDLGDAETRYRALREYGDYPRQVGIIETAAGIPYFRERLPSSHDKSTHVIPIVPGDRVNDVGVWAAVQSVEDQTPVNPDSFARLRFEVVIIAEYSEFADRSGLGSARER